jgi:multisubunit Na+/H+ antiporter MnhB subunit
MESRAHLSGLGLAGVAATAPAIALLVAVFLRYPLEEAGERVLYAAWGVAMVGVLLVVLLALALGAAAAASALRPRR